MCAHISPEDIHMQAIVRHAKLMRTNALLARDFLHAATRILRYGENIDTVLDSAAEDPELGALCREELVRFFSPLQPG